MIEIRHDRMDEIQNIRQSYNQTYSAEGILHRDSLYEWLVELLKAPAGSSLLDVACGEGRLVTLARQRGLRASGVDFSAQGVRIGQQATPGAGWVVADGENLPFVAHSFNYLTNVGSLEHFISPEQGAREMARVLKVGGTACVMVPNVFGLFGNIQKAARTGDVHDDGQPLQRYATRRVWESLLETSGLRVEKVLANDEINLRKWSDLGWLLRRPQKIVRLILAAFVPVNLANHFVFLCRNA